MTRPFDAVDLFAGPGGWDQGAKSLGLRTVGLEWDHAACQTAVAAGHPRIRCDVAQYPTAPFAGIPGLIASPPCQAWSSAGNGKGELDRANCHKLADRMAVGDDSLDWTEWEDERSPLVCQPVRWVRDLRPEWVALEEVPAVLGLWEHYARIFREWGYSAWVGVLNAADYGVPQTRQRVILMASRAVRVAPPAPTHSQDGEMADLFGAASEKWVSMADALNWGRTTVDRRQTGAPVVDVTERPAPTLTSSAGAAGVWVLRTAMNPARTRYRPITEPAATIAMGNDGGHGWRWTNGLERVRFDVSHAATIQSFPPGYPWAGSKVERFRQVGNAVPPRLATHVLAALTGVSVQEVAA